MRELYVLYGGILSFSRMTFNPPLHLTVTYKQKVRWGLVMIADMHVHSTFSPDGISTMEEQCIAALEKGERIICFTDHVDYNVAEKNNGIIKDNSKANFIIEEYLIEIDRLRKKYPELKILKGIEFSEPHLFKKEFERYSQYPFDYILGSVHHCTC